MRGHEGGQLGAVVVGAHEEVALVLICGVAGRRLGCSSQPLKVELVRIPFPVYFCHNILVVVVSVYKGRGLLCYYCYFINVTHNL